MRNTILAIAAITAVVGAPIAASAQSDVPQNNMTVGVARGSAGVAGPVPAVVEDNAEGIPADQFPAFRQYITREHVPEYTIPDRVAVGSVLPETGVTYYDVPQTYGMTPYRYTVVNGQTILIEPRTRRIVQVIN